ncbi:MAG: HEPN domain-containing protein [Pirellulales bacterium]
MRSAGEATYRTAVSRAYYGAFHVAHGFLHELGLRPPANANVHGFVQHYLNGSKHGDACRAASLLSHLHAARIRADYRLDGPQFSSQQDAMLIVEQAALVVSALNNCRSEGAWGSIRHAIAEYEQKINPRP